MPYQIPPEEDIRKPNHGPHALLPTARVNSDYLKIEFRFCAILDFLESTRIDPEDVLFGSRHNDLENLVYHGLSVLRRHKEMEWHRQGSVESRSINTEMYFTYQHPPAPSLVAINLATLINMLFFHLSRRAAEMNLAAGRCVLRSTPALLPYAEAVPMDPRTLLHRYPIDPITKIYACCPGCCCLYPYNVGSGKSYIPNQCTHKATLGSKLCGNSLWRTQHICSKEYRVPALKLELQDVIQWIGRFLSRKGIEEYLENSFRQPSKSPMETMWDADTLWRLKGRDGKMFFPGLHNETRLAFGWSMDSFNPFHMKTAKQTVSSTGIWLWCLNDKPSLDQINHFLELLTAVFHDLWHPGVHYTRTYKHPSGRLVKAMLIPNTSDMLAARQAGGFSSATSHHFCTGCGLDIRDIENTDPATWPQRDIREHIKHAKEWRDAKNESAREECFDKHGIRWTPLYDLPYWDPIRFTLMEPAHTFSSGLLDHHVRKAFRININVTGGVGWPAPIGDILPSAALDTCQTLIEDNKNLQETLIYCSCLKFAVCWDKIYYCRKYCTIGELSFLTMAIILANLDYYRGRLLVERMCLCCQRPADTASLNSGMSTDGDSLSQPRTEAEVQAVTNLQRLVARGAKYNTVNNAGRKLIFQFLCHDLGLSTKGTKVELYSQLKQKSGPPLNLARYEETQQTPKLDSSLRIVLGSYIMNRVWEDMSKTQLPSWICAAPKHWGTKKHGKLGSSQWNTICLVHLVITLLKLWGPLPISDRRRLLLDNYIELMKAVIIGNLRAIDQDHINEYSRTIKSYMDGCKELYKDTPVYPVQHSAMHWGDDLFGWGPGTCRNGNFYERIIQKLQDTNFNNKFGELEATMLKKFCQVSNLRSLLLDDAAISSQAPELVEKFKAYCDEDLRGTRLAFMAHARRSGPDIAYHHTSLSQVTLSHSTHMCLATCIAKNHGVWTIPALLPHAQSLKYMSLRGVKYATCDHLPRDSDIIFREMDNKGKLGSHHAGQIYEILIHRYTVPISASPNAKLKEHESVFFTVKPYKPLDLSEQSLDSHYRRYGFLGGWLCSSTQIDPLVIDSTALVSHMGKTPVEVDSRADMIHILSLDKVCFIDPHSLEMLIWTPIVRNVVYETDGTA
ncbi:hypothetical protein OF83DRAFT_1068993 [Amylostereum chailletii]|nr:hypothetical protein OF83DRAFT_1068993 [Amylostereum chailletii]